MLEERNRPSKIHWPSAAQLGLSLAAALALWSLAAGLAVVGLAQYFGSADLRAQGLAQLLMAAGLGLSGALLMPSAGLALARLVGRPVKSLPGWPRFSQPELLILVLPVVLLLGYGVSKLDSLAWLALPFLHVLAIGLPVWWLARLGQRGLPAGSAQRQWGIFSSGLVLGPALILAVELTVLLALIVGGALWMARDTELAARLPLLAQQLAIGQPDEEEILRLLGPYLVRPGVIFAVLSFGAVLVPLIEEALKPIGVWLIAGRAITPAEGFTAGILSGAGYALFETLALASGGQDWAVLVFARIGTAIVHILTTGLSGWALASAWGQGRYLRLGAVYALVVFIHGLWNSLTLAISFNDLAQALSQPQALPLFVSISRFAPYALAALASIGLLALLWINRLLRREAGMAVV